MKFFVVILMLSISACNQFGLVKPLPEKLTNNAVAMVNSGSKLELFSFNGLKEGKSWDNITNNAFHYLKGSWEAIGSPLKSLPVLASTAVSIGSDVYLIGGYTVSEKKEEKSVAEIYKLNTKTLQWSVATKMPTPVDDTVALVYKKRYIYLISGWHDTDNVNLVQVYDTFENKWFNATNFTAPAVFGHAGGIIKNQLLVCDGVKVVVLDEGRSFVPSPVCVIGYIDSNNPELISWETIQHHSNIGYYRMAATGDSKNNRFVFVGGSDNPYNFDGIGYNGIASEPSEKIFVFNTKSQTWSEFSGIINATMDHRALLLDGNNFYIIGGMIAGQKVSNKVIKFKIPNITKEE